MKFGLHQKQRRVCRLRRRRHTLDTFPDRKNFGSIVIKSDNSNLQ